MSIPVFKWFEIEIELHDTVFKPGTDAILLGAWTSQFDISPGRILDAGTGSGILALMMARKFPNAFIDAIDISAEAVAIASLQFQHSMWSNRLRAHVGDVRDAPVQSHVYNLTICNPPYFFGQLSSPQEMRSRSKHGDDTVSSWVKGLCHRTQASGMIMMVIPYEDAFQWIREFNECKWFVMKRMNVFTTSSSPQPKRSLIAFRDTIQTPVTEDICLEDENQNPTALYRTWFDRDVK